MNTKELQNLLMAEHSKAQIMKVVNAIGSGAACFENLWTLHTSKSPPLPQRTSWAIHHLAEQYPALLQPFVPDLIRQLPSALHPAEARCIVKALSLLEIPEACMAPLFDLCLTYTCSEQSPIAVRVYAMSILCNLAIKEPGLKEEVLLVLNDLTNHPAPAIVSRSKRLRKLLQQKR